MKDLALILLGFRLQKIQNFKGIIMDVTGQTLVFLLYALGLITFNFQLCLLMIIFCILLRPIKSRQVMCFSICYFVFCIPFNSCLIVVLRRL